MKTVNIEPFNWRHLEPPSFHWQCHRHKFQLEFWELSLVGSLKAIGLFSCVVWRHFGGCFQNLGIKVGSESKSMLLTGLKVCFFQSVRTDRLPAITSSWAGQTGPGRQCENICWMDLLTGSCFFSLFLYFFFSFSFTPFIMSLTWWT